MNFKTVLHFNHSAILLLLPAFTLVFTSAVTAPAADIDDSFDFEGNIPVEIIYDDSAGDEYCEDEYCEAEYCEDEYCEEDEENYDSLFENLENDNLMYIDTSFAWNNQTINSGRFDYRTLGPDDVISIPLVDSSQDKFYVHPVVNQVTSRFGRRGNQWHYGTDVRLRRGDPVKSALDGIVRVIQFDRHGYGNVVVVRHHNGLETLYGHLSRVMVKPNEPVKAGDILGLGGSTGRSTGAHLHFEIRYFGEPFDPEHIIDFDNYVLKSDTLVLTRDNFEYLTEVRRTVYHTIRRGDTLSGIARSYGTTVSNLCRLNGITPQTILRIGRRLVVRSGAEVERQIVSVNPTQVSTNQQNAQTPAISEDPVALATPANVYHTVRSGENLSRIARRYGTTVNNLCRLNDITPQTILRVGRRLLVRGEAEAARQGNAD
jgi:murein DD-endopeptidase MepM/ murein hydrolase activator NlpD